MRARDRNGFWRDRPGILARSGMRECAFRSSASREEPVQDELRSVDSARMADGPIRIAHLSDLHCGGQYFEPNLLERAIAEINDLEPGHRHLHGGSHDAGLSGTSTRSRASTSTRSSASRSSSFPGNHDSRNVGYVHFEEMFGSRNSVLRKNGVAIVAVDSTEPDLDHGQIGRGRYPWIETEFAAEPSVFRIFVLHHHLLPVPGTGRERNVVYDAGDAIECLLRANVHLVLSGPQARAVRVAAREPLRREHGHGLVAAAARQHAALLQRDRAQRHARRHLAAAIHSTGASASSSSRPRRSSTRSTPARSTGR